MINVELMNQYRMIIDIDGEKHEDLFRTIKTLTGLKESNTFARFEGIQDRAQWVTDEPVLCVYARVMHTNGDINIVREFEENEIGESGYYTLDELKKYDLVWVKGYGIVDDFDAFESAYKEAATKK